MTPAAPNAVHGNGQRIGTTLSRVRFKDVIVLQGPPLMGLAFGWATLGPQGLWTLPVFVFASCLLVAHIFCLNDWAGIATDRRDANTAGHASLAGGTSRGDMARLALGLGALSLVLFGLLPPRTLLTAIGITVLSLLYSHPLVAGKGIPILSSVLHVTGGVLHFLLGYGLFGRIDPRGVLVAIYFGVTFAAGHLAQEVGDYEADGLNAIRTNAVRFERRRTFVASFWLFTTAYALIVGLGYAGVVPSALMGLVVFYPVHAVLFWRALKSGLTFDDVSRYRNQYRQLHVLIGLAMCAALLGERISP
jgi:4-hydroxybenzoate polyprenyltransferase